MFFISNAYAQTAPAAPAAGGPESLLTMIGPFLLLIAVFYFLILRPQQKRQKEQKAMVEALSKGDEVLTVGGIVGKITELSDQYMTLQVASVDGKPVEISMQRGSVQAPLPKGTMKSL